MKHYTEQYISPSNPTEETPQVPAQIRPIRIQIAGPRLPAQSLKIVAIALQVLAHRLAVDTEPSGNLRVVQTLWENPRFDYVGSPTHGWR